MDGSTHSGGGLSPPLFSRRSALVFGGAAFALGGGAFSMLRGCKEDDPYGGFGTIEFDDAPAWTTEGLDETFDGNFFQLPLARYPDGTRNLPDVKLGEVAPGKSLILVMTRGTQPGGTICIFCATQTSRLVSNYKKLSDRKAEVVVVFPISAPEEKSQGVVFKNKVFAELKDPPEKVPFPITFDVELKLVDALGIRERLSKPATYIFDPAGQIRFAYVGKNITDRPSVEAILKKLSEIESETSKTVDVDRGQEKGLTSS